MKQKIAYGLFMVIGLCNLSISAQPFTLDEKIKPVKLELTKHPKYEGAKYAEGNYSLNSGKTSYHYVKGHDVFQYVDIFIFSDNENADIQADLVFNTWNNIEETKHTSKSELGIINLKVRSWQDIGFTVRSAKTTNIDYSIIVNASEPIMNYLSSPFVKATEENLSTTTSIEQAAPGPNTSTQINWFIYALIGVLLVLVGLMAGKLSARKKTLILILITISFGFSSASYSQSIGVERARQNNLERELEYRRERNSTSASTRGHIGKMIGRINQGFGTADAAENYFRQYRNLGSCLQSGSPPGQPRIPSFCEDESSCAHCFSSARANFNKSRYNLEKLQTIYDCSTSYLNAAIAFGDNVSGYHGVVGLVWQSKKREIEKSMRELDEAYDKKRLEMLQSFHEKLIELDECEREHGMEDWYDRFGVMFYNFAEMRYHR